MQLVAFVQHRSLAGHPNTPVDGNWGIFDMHGNVFEWCFDASAGPGARQPFRGGSWFNCPVCAKCDSRSMSEPTTREPTLGFRVVRTPD